MRLTLSVMFVLLPIVAFAQARGAQVKRSNPPALSKPTGYTNASRSLDPRKRCTSPVRFRWTRTARSWARAT